MRDHFTTRWFVTWTALSAFPLPATAADNEKGLDFFEKKIRPVLVKQCYRCHSADAQSKKRLKGNLLVDTKAGLLKGGDTGPAVVPGNVKKSILLQALSYGNKAFEMPPSGKLPENVIADFTKWVEMGAPDPRGGQVVQKKHEIDIEGGRKFWSIRPLQPHQPPQVNDKA